MRRYLSPALIALYAAYVSQALFVGSVTCSDDGFFHINKAVALEEIYRSGHLYSRWSPHLARGFGYPIFNFYSPLASYLLLALHNVGLIYPVALHTLFFASIVLAGVGAYLLVRQWSGDAAGVVGAVVYLSAPYFAFDVLFRSALAETVALTFLPFILYTLHRTTTTPSARNCGIAALTLAGLLYAHNATALAFAPLAALYVLFVAWLHNSRRGLVAGAASVALALGLSAFFWLPALAEIELVQTHRLLVPPIFTYYTNYLSAAELFALPGAIDPLLINPSPAKALGVAAAVLALLGTAASLWKRNRLSVGFGLFFFGAFAVYSFLTLQVSQPLWDHLPLIKFVQFPWRLLSIISLCAAVLAGAIVSIQARRSWAVATALCVLIGVSHLSWWVPRYCAEFKESNIGSALEYEFATFTIGTSAKAEFLPNTVQYLPDDRSVADALIRGETPNYLDGLPTNATLNVINNDPLDFRAELALPAPATITFKQFYFEGWRAEIDGRPAIIRVSPGTGLITVPVPAGEHSLHFYFGTTPVRTAAGIISLIALIGLGYMLIVTGNSPPHSRPADASSPPAYAFLAAAVLILSRVTWIESTINPLRQSAFNGQSVDVGTPLHAPLAGGLNVLAYQHPAQIKSGDSFDVLLYLAPREPAEVEYRPRFDVVAADGTVWNDGNNALPPRWHKEPPGTQYWGVGTYAQWARLETLQPGTPPGDYQLIATVFNHNTLQPASVVDNNGNPLSPTISLGALRVVRPARPPLPSELNMQYAVEQNFGHITLLGYNLDRTEARPGDNVLVTVFIRSNVTAPHLRFTLFEPSYAPSNWQEGDIWRFQFFKRIPANAPDGDYRFHFAIADQPNASVALHPIRITAPERVFTPPAFDQPVAIRFGGSIDLAGYSILPSPDALAVSLIWHTVATPDQDLLAFIHVQDSNGNIVAQSDAVPADWARPTTGWLPGEYITDVRRMAALPPGDYTLLAGFADRNSGARLLSEQGDRAVIGVYKVP